MKECKATLLEVNLTEVGMESIFGESTPFIEELVAKYVLIAKLQHADSRNFGFVALNSL